MTHVNYDDVLAQLTGAGIIVQGGLQVDTAKPVRCKVDGDRERRGWYRLYTLAMAGGDQLITGSFGVWRGDDNGATKVELPKGERKRLDPAQQAAIKARQQDDARRAAAEREAEIQKAAARASRWWAQAEPAGESPYLTKKGLPPGKLYGARLSPSGNLVIPMQDGRGGTYGLQVIYQANPKEQKRELGKQYTPPGMSKAGKWFQIGSPAASGGIILVCEGFATGASLHEATGLPVAVAFDAGNLQPVAEQLKKLHRGRLKMLFAADDDYLGTCRECKAYTLVAEPTCSSCGKPHGKENTGVARARTAALAVDGAVVVPVFEGERPTNRKGPTDFNDLHVWPAGGLDAVRCQVEASLTAKGWSVAAGKLLAAVAPAPGAAGEGGGEREAMRSIIPIHEAAERFALVYGGKGTLFDFEEHLLVPKADVLDILPEHGWRDLRALKQVVRLDEVGFDPAGTDARIRCNLWGGWPTVPKAGKCTVLLELLEYLCSGEKNAREVYQWVLKWLAFPIQHPGAKMKTALIFHGPQGTGKNLFFESVMQVYGEYGRIVDQSAIEDKFNDWASRKLFLIADEVVARQELFHVKNKLKGLITGEWIRINPKNVSAHDERNHVNIVFLSNEQRPLVLEKDDRRYTVIYTPEKLPKSFYEGVRDELAAGGIAALHHHLATLDLGDFHEHAEAPMTKAKADLIEVSLGSTERFHADWEAGETPHPFCPCSSADLYTAYKRWCAGQGIARPREQTEVISYFGKLSGWYRGHADRYDTTHYTGETRRQRFVIPSEESLNQAAKRAKAEGDYRKPDAKTKSQWLTDCFWAFKNTLKDDEGWAGGDSGH